MDNARYKRTPRLRRHWCQQGREKAHHPLAGGHSFLSLMPNRFAVFMVSQEREQEKKQERVRTREMAASRLRPKRKHVYRGNWKDNEKKMGNEKKKRQHRRPPRPPPIRVAGYPQESKSTRVCNLVPLQLHGGTERIARPSSRGAGEKHYGRIRKMETTGGGSRRWLGR